MTYPLSQTQMGIYVTCMNSKEEGNYNIDMLYKLDDDVDIERLAKALDKVIEAHPYVKSRLVTNDEGEVVFEDHSEDEFHTPIFEVYDIEDVRQHLGEDYDLMHDQLFRIEVYKTPSLGEGRGGLYLYVDFHHIIFDGMSFVNFTSELSRAYAGEAPLGEEINGFEIAQAEAALRQSQDYQTAKEWFQTEYAEAAEVESTPIPDVYSSESEHFIDTIVPLNIDSEQIAAFCQKQDVRESILLTAAFGMMLGKYTADDKVLFNTIYHGRTDRRTRKSFCMMVQTMPVFLDMSKSNIVNELLGRLQTQISTARNNSGYSYGEVCSDLGLKSEICFAYQGGLNSFGLTLDGRPQQEEYLYKHHPGIQISIRLVVENGQYKAKIDYPAHKYSKEMIQGMMESFCNIVAEMCKKDLLADIEICNAEQIAQLDSFNHPIPDVPKDTVLGAFQRAARQYPDNIAAVFKEKHYTYRELDELTDRIGVLIQNSLPIKGEGWGEGLPVVSILIPRNEYMFILPLAAMKAGCAYQPLDPSYPQERLNFMVKDADAAVLIADPELRDIINEYEGEVILTSELQKVGEKLISVSDTEMSEKLEKKDLLPGSLMILLYTSGSTGVPKGVMLEHQNIIEFCTWYHRYYDVTPESRIAAYASFGFDACMMDLYSALTIGAAVHIIPEDIRLDIMAINEYFEANAISHCFMTTQVGVQFLLNADNHSLKHLSVGGEKLMSVDPATNYQLHNGYGPTECSIFTTIFPVDHKEPNIPIGKPLDSHTCYVMDKNLHRLPVGAAGELVIVGPQVGRGYLNRPDKTAEAFFKINGQRAYHSGDIVRYREDGNIEFVGRKDGQVKIRGFRIELKEVEAVIRDFPGINDVTVQAFDDPNGGKFIAAYVVMSGDQPLDTDALNQFILDQKPPYMVPAVTMQIEQIPLNVNQKVDKKALPKPELGTKSDSGEAVAPQNELQAELKAIVAGIVHTEDFGITDILGFVGLTSISSIKLSAQIYKKYGVQVDSKSLAKTATILSIEEQINASTGNASEPETYERYTEAPLTHSQQGVYVDCVNNADSVIYNIPVAIEMPHGVTVEQLDKALRDFVAAHSYINCRFVSDEEGNTIQQQITDFKLDIPVKELTPEQFEQEKKDFVRPFNLAEGPLYRFGIVHCILSNCKLLADFHHLISDGGSVDLFLHQLCSLLDGEKIEAERYDYYNFARDQKISDETEAFYEEQLSQIEEASALLPDVYDSDNSHIKAALTVSTDLNAVAEKCKKLGITPAAFYLAATAITISKYVAEEMVGICTISNGRSNSKITEAMGMYVNTLPLVSKVDAAMTVDEYLINTAKVFTETIAHEDYPFAKIAEKYNYAASIMYAYQVGVIEKYMTKEGELKMESLELDLAKFPVYVSVNGDTTAANIKVEYDTCLFSEAMMQGVADAVKTVAEELLCKDTLGDIEICSKEQIAILDTFNHAMPSIEEETILGAFQKAAKQYPDNIAAIFKDRKYTYRELDELTDSIGSTIYSKVKECGKTEPVVSILIPRNEYMFILPLAAMKAGCAYQPLDPSYPQERLNFMVKDADAAVLIADPELRDIINEYEGEVILTSELGELGNSRENLGLPMINLTPNSLFILLYTSGSTGVPKGVMLEHQNIIEFCAWYHRYYNLTPESSVAAYASFGFDACMMDMYSALTLGATVHIIPEEIRLDIMAINDYFEANNITHCFMTTQVGVQFLLNADNHSLKHLSVGGEKLMSVDPATNYQLHNAYGPTECSIFTTIFPVMKKEPNIPIGKPLDSHTCYVMDKYLHRLPVGAAGELVIVGPQVGRGYLNRPEKTAEAFFQYPSANTQHPKPKTQRAYHSGDIVRYRQDGNIEFVGRKDGQVKIRGFRIELKEVEAVIRDFPGVKDVTVQAFDDPNGGKFIAAYVVMSSDQSLETDALNQFILDQKPPYMVPAVTMQIEKIPLNVNQKVDKKALPKASPTALPRREGTACAPLNALEEELKAIIASVVNNEDFGITDVLGYVGLTSISGIKLATLIYKKYGVQVNAKTLAKTGTLQSIENEILQKWMSGEVKTTSSEQSEVSKDSSPRGGREGASALTYPQMGVYLDCMKHPDSVMYNVPLKMTVPNSVTPEELADAVKATVENHSSFKMTFSNTPDGPQQIFHSEMPVDVIVTQRTEEDVEEYKRDFIRPFNLAQGPLFRLEIVTTGQNMHLFMDMHHLVTDGGSANIILNEITARLNNQTVETEDYSYLQFAIDQQNDTDEYNAAKEFFHSRLQTCEGASEITSDLPKNDLPHTEGHCTCPVDMKAVEDVARKLGVTPMSAFLAATYYVVSRFVNNKQVYLGTISNGRSNLKTYNTTGMFVNTLALSSEIKEQTVADYIKETAQYFAETIEHEQYPFAQIAADYGFHPEIVFEYQVGVISDYVVRGESLVMDNSLELDIAKFKIKIVVRGNDNDGYAIKIGYDTALYSERLASCLAESMSAAVEHFVAQPSSLVKSISIMSDAQRQTVEAFHTTATADVPFKRFYEPIEYWAEKTPDALAVYACDRKLTFREFNEECNRVANALMARGVKKGDRVVLLLPRTSQVLCCIFGVSKTGAAYIPCDPAYPADRISLILEDSEAKYVITTAEHMDEHGGKAILVDELFEETNISSPNVEVTPDDLAYLIYTSGSTGRPKGVMLRHAGICSYLYDHPANIHIHGLKEEGVTAFLCITTLSFDMSLKEFAGALHNGITAVLANEDEVNNPMLLAELFRKTGAQVINGTPSRILNCMESEDFCEALSHCKCIWSGGEKYSDKLLQRLHAMNLRIFNTYGPTEITVSSNIGELTHQENITVGRPLLNYTEFVVDSDGNELPVGVVGELYIGGPGVARGYNNLPEQTAARFIEYPSTGSGQAGIRVYKSGDYARWLPDGQVDILGRLDNQVKLNGLRIELGEVESAISKVEGVKQTVVMIRNIDGRDHLSAYYVADRKIDIEDMKAQIGQTLTHYMVPTAYLQMDKFPLTPNGKTDIKNLPMPQMAQVGGDYVAPKNKAEEDFCHVFEKILGLEKVSAADSFFDLGGTSLTATRVLIEAKNYGYDIAYSDVFKYVTPQQLAQLTSPELSQGEEKVRDSEVEDYDYTKINALLAENNLDNFLKGERLELGDIILTGANGYLGIHILHNLLENHLKQHPEYKVYCLVRHGRNGVSSEARLRNLLFYYFEKNYKETLSPALPLYGEGASNAQVIVIDGDVTDKKAFDQLEQVMAANSNHSLPFGGGSGKGATLINCAAIVKHFSEGTEIEDINVGGLQNCVDFCLKTGARLIQTSTNSTGGRSVNGYPDPQSIYSEQTHYFGQSLTSKYAHSKFIAERIVLEAIIEKGLVAKVVRLGNLAPRVTDGEFQINFRSNSAMGRLHIYQMLGCISYSLVEGKMEFSPIDEVSEAVLRLSTAPKECCVFHPFNNHMVNLGDVVREMGKILDINISEVETEEFETRLSAAAQDPDKAKVLQSMLAYKAGSKDKVTIFQKFNPYTIQVLLRLGFHWNVTSWDYVQRFIKAIAAMDFFEDHR